MVEFTISFQYKNEVQRAGVVKSLTDQAIEYDIRPINPLIVSKFGKQISIYRINEDFNTGNHIDKDYHEFFTALVTALREQDVDDVNDLG